jgi:hypothetical protein
MSDFRKTSSWKSVLISWYPAARRSSRLSSSNFGEQTGRRLDFFRLDLVDDIVKLQRGDPICIVYDYVEQLDELRKRYPGAPVLGQKTTRKQAQDAYNRWNDGLLKQIIMHPASAGHGLNMQYGGHKLVRCSLPWSLDYFEQVPLRFAREGQTAAATKSWDLTARDTVEEHLYQLLVAKAHTQDGVFTWPANFELAGLLPIERSMSS